MGEKQKPDQKKRWWNSDDYGGAIMILCVLFALYMIGKGIFGLITGQ